MSSRRNACALFLTAALFAVPAAGQSLDGQIQRNPDDTVTYTIDIDGPPRGRAFLFVSPLLMPQPIPTPFGPLFINPYLLIPVHPLFNFDLPKQETTKRPERSPRVLTPRISIGNSGQESFQFTVPQSLTEGVPLVFQSLNIDEANTVRLSQDAIALGHNAMGFQPKNFDYTYAYGTGEQKVRFAGNATPGQTIEVRVVDNNGTRVTQQTTVAADGTFLLEVDIPGGLTENDDTLILCGGQLMDKVDLHKFK